MGHSQTINVIGFSAPEPLPDGSHRRYECHAMTKMEMLQEAKKMAGRDMPVIGWFAQTNAGCRMLGPGVDIWEEIRADKIKYGIKPVTCPICQGRTSRNCGPGMTAHCPVCNGSGITRQNHWLKWRQWQLDRMKAEFSQSKS